jgi:lipopolysaccharide transport system permease protein
VASRYAIHRVRSEIKSEVSNYYLSYLWWILEPCLMIAVFYVVFAKLFGRGGDDFVAFLLLGVTAWLWFAHSVLKSSQSIRSATGLMLQVYVPKFVFPLSSVLFHLFKHLFVMAVLLGLLVLLAEPTIYWLFYPLIFTVQLLLIFAVSYLLAAIIPFVPDLTKVLPPLMQMTMFLSGLFYEVSIIPTRYVEYFRYNPMAGLIMEYRKVVLLGVQPDYDYLFKVALFSSLLLLVGIGILKRFDRVYPRLVG